MANWLGSLKSNRWVRRFVGPVYWRLWSKSFSDSRRYWEDRYQTGGSSGPGSAGALRVYKADVLNAFVALHHIHKVLEFGCGDGAQLQLADYPAYHGLDVSQEALRRCREQFDADPTKSFAQLRDVGDERADLVLSLDVIYHLVEDDVFDAHMGQLFRSSDRFVGIYSSNTDKNPAGPPHVRNRMFAAWIERNAPQWLLHSHVENPITANKYGLRGSMAEFYFFEKDSSQD